MKNPIPDFDQRASKIKKHKSKFLRLAKQFGTPMYVYDSQEAVGNLSRFVRAFRAADCAVKPFYAIKSNPYQGLLDTLVKNGAGLDASSPRELQFALKAKAKKIIYTGPAKDEQILRLILKHRQRVFMHLDSFQELKTLSKILRQSKQKLECGVRVYGSKQESWSKFGIPLRELPKFYREAGKNPLIKISAIQFHTSFNKDSKRYVQTIRELGEFFRLKLPESARDQLKAIDIGGGYAPAAFEGYYPWNKNMDIKLAYPKGLLQRILNDKIKPRALPIKTTSIETLASEIGGAFNKYIKSWAPNIELWAEPGRFICHSTMHLLLSVADIKPKRKALITDGGNNMVGYEKHQWQDYAPIFNLSHFSTQREIPWLIYGSLCTTNDLWGYYVYTQSLNVGDILVLPYQGAYTYTLAQNFIREVPETHALF